MTINDREITLVECSTKENWINHLPTSNWLCIIVDDGKSREYLDKVISKIIDNDVCYVCTVGQSCEQVHDLIDEEIALRGLDLEKVYLQDHFIMTTWHDDFEEGIWFAIFAAHHDELSIDKIVLLDMTDGKELNRINKLLMEFK